MQLAFLSDFLVLCTDFSGMRSLKIFRVMVTGLSLHIRISRSGPSEGMILIGPSSGSPLRACSLQTIPFDRLMKIESPPRTLPDLARAVWFETITTHDLTTSHAAPLPAGICRTLES